MEDPEARARKALVIHDGELEDIRELLEEIGAPYAEHRGAPDEAVARSAWSLVVGTPRRMLDLDALPRELAAASRPAAIAVLEADSRTLRANLRRSGVGLLVRRPVHPAALRLLLLHALYRGPERRRAERMSVGIPIRFRAGFWPRPAILTELSMHGCGLLCRQFIQPGRRVTVYLPARLGVGPILGVRGTAVRCGPAPGEEPRSRAVAVQFGELSPSARQRLQNAVMIHACGPATLPGAPIREPGPRKSPPVSEPPPPQPADRRSEPRRDFSRRVIGLGGNAARVLLGRDLSRGGMRIDPNPHLAVGDELRLAVPLRAGETPLVIDAKVTRDDGDEGLTLQFRDLSETVEMQLKRMLDFLPICGSRPDPEADYASLVVSEILGRCPE